MPIRLTPLVTEEVYHIFNRSVDRKPVLASPANNRRAWETLAYYRFKDISVRFSYFLTWAKERREELLEKLTREQKLLVEIICFCLMPNHFHLLLKQKEENGISKFLAQFQNSFTRYFNTKNKRDGHVFAGQFKAVRIETDEQLFHVSRYIHLNPYSSFVVKNISDLLSYTWSSLPEYLDKAKGFCHKEIVLSGFKNNLDYKKFVLNQADYQRKLDTIKHLTLEG